jgi:hypothetical protein
MTRRLLAVVWLAIGVAVFNGFFDLYISRGAREYLQLQAEYQLGRREEPSMAGVMDQARRMGLIASTGWAVLVTGAGLGTLAVTGRRPSGGAGD